MDDVRRQLVAVTLGLISCAAPEVRTPDEARAPIVTDKTRYRFEHDVCGPETTIISTFHAPRDRKVYVLHCNQAISTGLQRLVDGKWVNSWGAERDACLSAPIVLSPGEAESEPITLRRGAGATLYPPGDRVRLLEPGTYRVVWYGVLLSVEDNLRTLGEELPLEQRVSAPFAIDAPPPRPAAIESFEPAENASDVRPAARVRITWRIPPQALRLIVDGSEVTDRALLTGTELTYAPDTGWSPGRHGVLVRGEDEEGNRVAWSWVFHVQTR
ncbi:MAG TPA: hypothetical protein VFL80_04630 [Thermoanaerobaculia bacterium]|nr:hypothetical protein [Thermoanaerobaculia bacterium]